MSRSHLWIGAACIVFVVIVLATAIPAPFTVDDCNYLSSVVGLRHGTVYVPGTAGLPPSRALHAFEPMAYMLKDPETPVPPHVPPLYAVVAYPFSFLGWHGLVLLNALATLGTVALVFAAARRLAGHERAGWYAAALWLFGASTIEYAQGLWPHMLSVSCAAGGMICVALAAKEGRDWQAALAGFLLAMAAGMRYQNSVLLGCGLIGLAIWAGKRLRSLAAFAAGAVPPVLTAALFNHARIGSWSPFSKGLHYMAVGAGNHGVSSPVGEFLLSVWTRVVDYSAQPPFHDRAQSYMRKIATGDIVVRWGVLKKSWLQGSPWVLVGFLAVLLAWVHKDFLTAAARSHLRQILLPVAAMLAVFGFAGVYRHDGLAYNQRYLLELAPLMAIAAGVSIAQRPLRWTWIASGASLGLGFAGLALLAFPGGERYRLQSILPLVLACVTACLVGLSLHRPRWTGPAGLALATCLAWSFTIHLATDLQGSRRGRESNQGRLEFAEAAFPSSSPMALLAATGPHDAFCPLLLDHDAVVLTGTDVPVEELLSVLDALLAQKRDVFVWLEGLPKELVSRLEASYRLEQARPPLLAKIAKSPR
jgi:4-amino-4-deoxy-L-arabinose transferase-like glycosyltransferase